MRLLRCFLRLDRLVATMASRIRTAGRNVLVETAKKSFNITLINIAYICKTTHMRAKGKELILQTICPRMESYDLSTAVYGRTFEHARECRPRLHHENQPVATGFKCSIICSIIVTRTRDASLLTLQPQDKAAIEDLRSHCAYIKARMER